MGRLAEPRIKPGTRLVRVWQGSLHEVTVLDAGFSYRGQTYASLSVIARQITGTRWSGPQFFGLKGGGRTIEAIGERAAPAKLQTAGAHGG